MGIGFNRWIRVMFVAASATALAVGCATNKEGKESKKENASRITIAQMPEPARVTVEKLIAGGKIEKIDKEMEKGKEVYDVEATVNGNHMEYTITTDGVVAGTETGIKFSEMPEAVQMAAENYFGGKTGLEAARVEEDGRIAYEVEGGKHGKKAAVTFDANGKRLEEEN